MRKLLMAGLFLVAGAMACSSPDDSARTPRDPRLQHLFVQGSSYGHRVTIYANEQQIWNGEFTSRSSPAWEPEVHELRLPAELTNHVSILGGPYKKIFKVDWTKGQRITIYFEKDGKAYGRQLKGSKVTLL